MRIHPRACGVRLYPPACELSNARLAGWNGWFPRVDGLRVVPCTGRFTGWLTGWTEGFTAWIECVTVKPERRTPYPTKTYLG